MRLAIADTLKAQEMEFQFTHPGKGATETQGLNSLPVRFQFTHPGKGATDNFTNVVAHAHVSIHAPWEGCG